MFKMDFASENMDSRKTVEEFNFDKRLDSKDILSEVQSNDVNDINFDERITNEDAEVQDSGYSDAFSLNEILVLFEPEAFAQFSDEEKAVLIDVLKDKLVEELQLENPPEMVVAELERESLCGYYTHDLNAIVINKSLLSDGVELRDTIAHEMRHAWQHMRAELPEDMQTAFDKALKENFENYISGQDNYRAYRAQLVEMDAREFASGIVEDMYAAFR